MKVQVEVDLQRGAWMDGEVRNGFLGLDGPSFHAACQALFFFVLAQTAASDDYYASACADYYR